jgi:acid phosphatase family membrane protein YuiD
MEFATIPIVTWFLCGVIKFVVNTARYGHEAVARIGHGGFPSNHTAIISSIMWASMLAQEWHMTGLALAVLMIYIFDATGLRREVGRHAAAINQYTGAELREIIGHNVLDIAGGLTVGLAVACAYVAVGAIP